MKKKSILFFIALLIAGLGFVKADEDYNQINTKKEMRGVWVASVLNINYPTYPTTNSALLKIEADNIIESAQNAGFNAIFLQVRPTADSLYKSDIFPWSKYLTGNEGVAPNNGFDPLAYFIQEAHKRNIEVHAWVNPYRITKRADGEGAYSINDLSPNHPARLHPEYVVSSGGNLYFDPALPEVRNLITDGIKEIVDNYDIDGIHFDDYFYPSKDFNDDESYRKYAHGKSLGDWRRDNVNKLVEQVYNTVHNSKKKNQDGSPKDVVFGISPFGIWANEEMMADGSRTAGDQSYFSHYADSKYWIENEIIDYITPQIYWNMGFEIADFKVLTDWWSDLIRGSNVDLYIGLAAYRSDNYNSNSPWYKNYELKRQLEYIDRDPMIDGFIAFSISSIRTSNRNYNAFRGSGEISPNAVYTYPSIGLYGGYTNQFVGGLIDPNSEAYLNNQKIFQVSDKGFFGHFLQGNHNKSYTLANVGKSVSKVYSPYTGAWKPNANGNASQRNNYNYLNGALESQVLFAKTKDEVDYRVDANPRNGSMELVPKDVVDEIEYIYGGMAKLTSNRYIEMSNVDIVNKKDLDNRIARAEYIVGEDEDKIVFYSNIKPFFRSYMKDNGLVLDVSGNIGMPSIYIPEGAIVQSCERGINGGRDAYFLDLGSVNKLGGYYTDYEDGKIIFGIKRKKTIKDNDKPLEGINIMLDAGHGGSDNGAKGLLSNAYPEKDVTLDITLKLNERLKNLGANVILTRDKDEFISLYDRLKAVHTEKPDLFISIHANSFPLYKDLNYIKGFSVYYSKDIAWQFASLSQGTLTKNTACIDNKARTADFYVIRGTHCPSVLLETGFMPNPEDFDWLCDDKKQDEFASELARTILLYFEYN